MLYHRPINYKEGRGGDLGEQRGTVLR